MTKPPVRPPDDDADDLATAAEGVLLPSGRVDAAAINRAMEQAGDTDDDDGLRRVTFTLRRDLKKRLDKYLTDRIGFMSRNQLQRVIAEGGVLVNGRAPKASTNLRQGDVVEVVIPPPPPTEIQPENIPLEVMYEDEHLVVINKAPDIIVHPARSHLKGTMINALAWHFREASPHGGALSTVGGEFARPGVVHRLDRHTSGVIVFAKRDEVHWRLGHQFERRQVDKRYLAVVEGHVEPDADVIDLPLGPHPSREKGYREKYVVRHDEQGKPAVTIVRVRERYLAAGAQTPGLEGHGSRLLGWNASQPGPSRDASPRHAGTYSLLELDLKTGRTHQIRVHLSHLGWPIVGDDMYGGRQYADESGIVIARQALHATMLSFLHPILGKRMTFTAPLRGDMSALVRSLRLRGPVERLEVPGTVVDLDAALGN
jgi:23S rRNA pseudouridine1911/1915/1917 synthase